MDELAYGSIIAMIEIERMVTTREEAKMSRWYVPGCIGWKVGRVVRLAVPIECRGAQGLWVVPDAVAAMVRLACWDEADALSTVDDAMMVRR